MTRAGPLPKDMEELTYSQRMEKFADVVAPVIVTYALARRPKEKELTKGLVRRDVLIKKHSRQKRKKVSA